MEKRDLTAEELKIEQEQKEAEMEEMRQLSQECFNDTDYMDHEQLESHLRGY